MQRIDLKLAPKLAGSAQLCLATFHAALEEQRRDLMADVGPLPIEALEWQVAPGCNTVGMLLAHVAIAEVYWMRAAAGGPPQDKKALDQAVHDTLHLAPDADGMPLEPGAGHPESLRGWTPTRYAALLGLAARCTESTLQDWNDASLDDTVLLTEHGEGFAISRRWVLYHVLEHMAQHLGQVRLLLAMNSRLGED